MLIKEFKHKYILRFENVEVKAHKLDKEETKKEIVAMASVDKLSSFIPKDFDYERNYDIVGWSANLYTPNLGNLNYQMTDGNSGIDIAKTFIGKQVNTDHSRHKTVGVITNVGFSTFPENNPISEEEARELAAKNEVFNVAIGGLVWRVVNEDLVAELEDSSDPNSLSYMSISTSWEVGLPDFKIAIGSKYYKDCLIIDDPIQIEEMKSDLTVFGGRGIAKNGKPMYALISGNCLGLGAAFTKIPAGAVKGVCTLETNKLLNQEITSSFTQDQVNEINKIANSFNKSNEEIGEDIKDEMDDGLSFEDAVKEVVDELNEDESVKEEIQEFSMAAKSKNNMSDECISKITEVAKRFKEEFPEKIAALGNGIGTLSQWDEQISFGRFYEKYLQDLWAISKDNNLELSDVLNRASLVASIDPVKFSINEVGKINALAQQYNVTTDEYCAYLSPYILAGESLDDAINKVNAELDKNTKRPIVVEKDLVDASIILSNEDLAEGLKKVGVSAEVAAKSIELIIAAMKTFSKKPLTSTEIINKLPKIDENFEKNSIILAKNLENQENTNSKTVNKNIITMLKSIKDLNDDNVKEISASLIKDTYAKDLAEAAKQYVDELAAEKEKIKKAEGDLVAANSKLVLLEKELNDIKTAQAEAKAEADFNSRMSFLNDEFELTDEARASIVEDVKACADDESFKKYVNKLSVFAKKKVKEEMKKEEKEVKASEVLKAAEVEAPEIPNTEVVEESVANKWANALSAAVKIEKK